MGNSVTASHTYIHTYIDTYIDTYIHTHRVNAEFANCDAPELLAKAIRPGLRERLDNENCVSVVPREVRGKCVDS